MTGTPVFLRNGTPARVTGQVGHIPPFEFVGRLETGVLDLWKHDGSWREDGTDHPLDIVSMLTPSGQLIALKGQSPV